MLKAGVLGAGHLGKIHLHIAAASTRYDLVGFYDPDPKTAASINSSYGYHPFESPEALIEACDVVDIVTTAPSHYNLAKLAASLNISAIIQKPMAPSLKEATKIVDLAETTKTPMMVHENFRFQYPLRVLKKIISNGEIGQYLFCKISFRTAYDVYRQQPYLKEVEQLILMDLGVHVLDLVRFLFGEATSISCRTQKTRSSRGPQKVSIFKEIIFISSSTLYLTPRNSNRGVCFL